MEAFQSVSRLFYNVVPPPPHSVLNIKSNTDRGGGACLYYAMASDARCDHVALHYVELKK